MTARITSNMAPTEERIAPDFMSVVKINYIPRDAEINSCSLYFQRIRFASIVTYRYELSLDTILNRSL